MNRDTVQAAHLTQLGRSILFYGNYPRYTGEGGAFSGFRERVEDDRPYHTEPESPGGSPRNTRPLPGKQKSWLERVNTRRGMWIVGLLSGLLHQSLSLSAGIFDLLARLFFFLQYPVYDLFHMFYLLG